MRNLIRKILKENDFGWVPSESSIPLTDYMLEFGIKPNEIYKLVGLKVMLSPKSGFYVEDEWGNSDSWNPINTSGVITNENTGDFTLPLMVDWDNGKFNSYNLDDLDLVIEP